MQLHIDVIQIVVIIVLAGVAWWANEQLNNIPILKKVVGVVIVVAGVLFLLQSLGIGTTQISVR